MDRPKSQVATGLILLWGLWGAACGNDANQRAEATSGGSSTVCSASIESLQRDIFATSCAGNGCHGAADPAVGLDLLSDGLAERLIEQPANSCDALLVAPGNPARSFLYEKLTAANPTCGDSMPLGQSLSNPELACVREWIRGLQVGCDTCGGTACVEFSNDAMNCGGCGVQCPGTATCSDGMCVCPEGKSLCAGLCVNTATDPQHCGACDAACASELVCSSGQCKGGCDAPLSACGSSCVNLKTDASHCGTCDVVCGTKEVCSDGNCGCGPGIDTQTDPQNCGSCGNVCPPGLSCSGGVCACGTASVSFASEIQPFLTKSCATIGCHRGNKPKASLDLTAAKAYGELVGQATTQCGGGRLRVKAGEPTASYLLDKILGTNLCFGSKMPKMGSVPAVELEAITNWICSGAPNN